MDDMYHNNVSISSIRSWYWQSAHIWYISQQCPAKLGDQSFRENILDTRIKYCIVGKQVPTDPLISEFGMAAAETCPVRSSAPHEIQDWPWIQTLQADWQWLSTLNTDLGQLFERQLLKLKFHDVHMRTCRGLTGFSTCQPVPPPPPPPPPSLQMKGISTTSFGIFGIWDQKGWLLLVGWELAWSQDKGVGDEGRAR